MSHLREHLYLVTTLFGMATVVACWWLAGPQRRMVLAAGAIYLPFFAMAGTYNDGSFWTPTHIEVPYLLPITAFGGPVGAEDMLCLFTAGARAWFFATLPARRTLIATATRWTFMRRAAAISAATIAAGTALRALGIGYVPISYVLPAALGAIMLSFRPAHWRLALPGAIGSALLAGLELRVYFALWPEWRAAWTPGAFTSADVLGVKLGDLIWWALVGAVHPLVIAYCAGTTRLAAAGREQAA